MAATKNIKRFFLGDPIATARASEERLPKRVALAVFSSDALSSVAYATEEILLVLVAAAAFRFSLPIAGAIIALLAILTISYRHVITAYPSGGGAYIVASDNFGHRTGLVAGSALLVDYVLTVAVSMSSGVAALTSAFPQLHDHRVGIAVILIVALTLGNLRGIRESGQIFALPTYAFIVGLAIMILTGIFRGFTGGDVPAAATETATTALGPVTLFLLLRAFSSGCAALTGVEAISNGVQSFEAPESKNARVTLVWMAVVLGALFMGITWLASSSHIIPNHHETVLSQLARGTFGTGPAYFYLQAATALILVLAANTSYADFPRVASIMAADGFLPHQLTNRGEKLAFSNGILMLSGLSIILIAVFGGSTSRLIPLYAVGVFTSFTLSQAGMVKHWFREREKGWRRKAVINGVGAVTTFTVLMVVTITKFTHGAWMVVLLIPLLIALFLSIKRHYENLAEQLSLENLCYFVKPAKNRVILCVGGVHVGTVVALRYAKMVVSQSDIEAVYVNTDGKQPHEILQKWNEHGMKTPLQIIDSPYRDIVGPIIDLVRKLRVEHRHDFITIIVPEFVCRRWWQHLLHNQTALVLKARLAFAPNVIVTSVPYHLDY